MCDSQMIAYSVAGGPQTTVRRSANNLHIRFILLGRLVQQLGHVSAFNENFGFGAHFLMELGDLLGGGPECSLFPCGTKIEAVWAINIRLGIDVSEREPGAEFGGQLCGPLHRLGVVRAQIDRTNDVMNSKRALALLPDGPRSRSDIHYRVALWM